MTSSGTFARNALAAAAACLVLALAVLLAPAAPALAAEDSTADLAAGTTADTAAGSTDSAKAAESPKPFTTKGVYYITASASKNQAVGMVKNDRTNKANTAIAKRKATNLLRFQLVPAGAKATFYLKNVATGRVLSATGATATSAKAQMLTNKKKAYQKWKVEVYADKTVTFTNVKTKLRLSVNGAKSKVGAKLSVRTAKDTAVQRFKLVKTKKNVNEVVKIGVPCYRQNPQLPTGCESVALTNALRYWGFGLKKTTIADRWMPYGGNGVYNFIGNPRNWSGWIICAPGITRTATKYLTYKKSDVRAKTVHGSSLKSLRTYLDQGCPVVVWTTIGMASPNYTGIWRSGYPLNGLNHAVVLTGYNPKTGKYQVSDSLAGIVWRNGSRFTSLYNAMGKQAVVLYD